MHNFNILFFNKRQNIWHKQTVESMTFAEAARTAYMIRNRRGFDWEIQSVAKAIKGQVE
jgi:hypothetical protein